MPLPKTLARINRVFLNKGMRPLAKVAPGFGVLQHRGRRSGVEYETPLNVFRDRARLVVALTYGADVDWLKNVRAAGGARFIIARRPIEVGLPVDLTAEEGMSVMPAGVRVILGALDINGFVAFPIITE